MKRVPNLFSSGLLIVSLVLSLAASGYLRLGHAIASAGNSEIVICGQDGTTVVTLDRNGAPVSPDTTTCGHCADCSLTPIVDLAGLAASPQRSLPTLPRALHPVASAPFLGTVDYPARGPPSKNLVT